MNYDHWTPIPRTISRLAATTRNTRALARLVAATSLGILLAASGSADAGGYYHGHHHHHGWHHGWYGPSVGFALGVGAGAVLAPPLVYEPAYDPPPAYYPASAPALPETDVAPSRPAPDYVPFDYGLGAPRSR